MSKCKCCDGTGQEVDDTYTGNQMRQLRLAAKMAQKEMAARLGVSGAYLSDLEHGYRHWNIPLTKEYISICQKGLAK